MTDGPRYSFTIETRPVAQGSMKAVPRGKTKGGRDRWVVVHDNDDDLKAYRARIAHAIRKAGVPMIDVPCSVIVTFWLPRPAGHMGTGRNADHVRDSAPSHPGVKPDVDKLARALLDGMKGRVIKDDSLVVNLLCYKRYVGREASSCSVVTVRPLIERSVDG